MSRLKKLPRVGSALFLILAIAGVLALFTGAVGIGALNNLQGMTREAQDDQARFMAMAGIQAGLARLSGVRNWPNAGNPYGQGDPWSYVNYNYQYDHLGLWSTSRPNLHAYVLAYNNSPGAFARTANGPDGVAIPDGRVLLISSGIYDTDASRRSTTVAALARPAGILFDKAVFGAADVKVLGTLVDCVDSNVAGWTPASYAPYDLTTVPVRNATVASNNTVTDSIVFDSGSKVDGNVYSGPNSPLGAIGYYGGFITGTDGSQSSAKDTNNVLPPATATLLGGGSDVIYGAGTWTLTAGTYKVNGNMSLSGGANLVVTGPTVLYIDGNFSASAASKLNIAGKPSDLQIYLTGGSSTLADLSGGSQASMLLAGLNVTVNVADSEIFGAVQGNRVNFTNSQLHYDTAVSTQFFGSTAWVTDSFLNQATTDMLAITVPPGGPPSDPMASGGGTVGGSVGGSSSGGSSSGGSVGGSSSGGSSSGGSVGGSVGGSSSGSSSSGSSSTGGSTGGSSSGGAGSGGVGGRPLRCCLDYSCGPPRCMIY